MWRFILLLAITGCAQAPAAVPSASVWAVTEVAATPCLCGEGQPCQCEDSCKCDLPIIYVHSPEWCGVCKEMQAEIGCCGEGLRFEFLSNEAEFPDWVKQYAEKHGYPVLFWGRGDQWFRYHGRHTAKQVRELWDRVSGLASIQSDENVNPDTGKPYTEEMLKLRERITREQGYPPPAGNVAETIIRAQAPPQATGQTWLYDGPGGMAYHLEQHHGVTAAGLTYDQQVQLHSDIHNGRRAVVPMQQFQQPCPPRG